jgi:hypothetical protein
MQNESVSSQIADVLTKNVISSDSLTMSLIGIQADLCWQDQQRPALFHRHRTEARVWRAAELQQGL